MFRESRTGGFILSVDIWGKDGQYTDGGRTDEDRQRIII